MIVFRQKKYGKIEKFPRLISHLIQIKLIFIYANFIFFIYQFQMDSYQIVIWWYQIKFFHIKLSFVHVKLTFSIGKSNFMDAKFEFRNAFINFINLVNFSWFRFFFVESSLKRYTKMYIYLYYLNIHKSYCSKKYNFIDENTKSQ